MSSEYSAIQSLKAVDAWIDVINANINGGVRTAFKASRLSFAGSNAQIDRPATASSLPLQYPESALVTANTVIDFTQGAITSSTETSHLAIQGEGFFMVAHPSMFDFNNAVGNIDFGTPLDPTLPDVKAHFLLTRDGEFHTDQHGFLVSSYGYYLVVCDINTNSQTFDYNAANFGDAGTQMRLVYNDLDSPGGPRDSAGNPYPHGDQIYFLSDFLSQEVDSILSGGGGSALMRVTSGMQNLRYSRFGSTVFEFGFYMTAGSAASRWDPNIRLERATTSHATILSKSLEASNSSMTQSVPELSLAQKLFSALTKVIQIHQTNVDAVLNTIR